MSWTAYAVEWTPASQRDLRALEAALVRRLIQAVKRYAETGDGDIKKLQGVEREWRLRVGDWRVLFTLDQAAHMLSVLRVLPRGGPYK